MSTDLNEAVAVSAMPTPRRRWFARVSTIEANLFANLAGRAINAVAVLVSVPLYVRLLGVEAWGLVGFHVTLQVVMSFLELGLPASVSREVAACNATNDRDFMQRLLMVAEIISLAIGAAMMIGIWSGESWIRTSWLNVGSANQETVGVSLQIMGVSLGLSFVQMVYVAGLNGLDRQVSLNVIQIFAAFTRVGLTLVLLKFVSATLPCYFIAQAAISLLTAITLRVVLARAAGFAAPKMSSAIEVSRRVWGFASAMTLNNVGQTAMVQADRLAVSKLLPMLDLGAYSVVGTLTSPISILAGTMSVAAYPSMCASAATGEREQFMSRLFKAGVVTSWLVWPASLVLFFWSRELLQLWTGDSAVADAADVPLKILALSAGVSALGRLLNQAFLALGKTGAVLAGTYAVAALFIPSVIVLCKTHGLLGAALSQLGASVVYLLVVTFTAQRQVPAFPVFKWLFGVVIGPAIIAAAGLSALRWGSSIISFK